MWRAGYQTHAETQRHDVMYDRTVTPQNFEQALTDFKSRQPFKTFYVEFVSGKVISIDHPEAVISRKGQAAHLAKDGAPSLFDHESVSRMFYSKRKPAEVTG